MPKGLCAAVLMLFITLPAAADDHLPFVTTQLTDNVFIFTEQTPWRSNHAVISTDRGLVLVDPGGSPAIARLLRQAIKMEFGHSRIAYVINHHHHWGHTWGNVAFPEAIVIGQEASVALMNRDAAFVANRLDPFRRQLDDARSRLEGLEASSDEAATARESRDQAEWILAGLGEHGFSVRPPDLTFSERLVLDLGNLTLELHALGRGHSETDTVLLIPEEHVLLTGCFFLVVDGVPQFGFQPQLDVDRWLRVLGGVLDGEAPVEHVVPGQHALWTPDDLRSWLDYIAVLWRGVQSLEAEGVTLAVAQQRLPVPPVLTGLVPQTVPADRLEEVHRQSIERLWRQLKESAASLLEQALNERGLEAALAASRQLRDLPDGEVFFSEGELNLLGYRLLGEQRIAEAIVFFELNVELFPQSWNVYDSLGEARMANGENERAIELYRRSLEINPDNTNAETMLERLDAAMRQQPGR